MVSTMREVKCLCASLKIYSINIQYQIHKIQHTKYNVGYSLGARLGFRALAPVLGFLFVIAGSRGNPTAPSMYITSGLASHGFMAFAGQIECGNLA